MALLVPYDSQMLFSQLKIVFDKLKETSFFWQMCWQHRDCSIHIERAFSLHGVILAQLGLLHKERVSQQLTKLSALIITKNISVHKTI